MLKISSYHDNSKMTGTLVVNGQEHTLDCQGSASERGTYAVIDGKTHWWCGEYNDNGEMEELCEQIFSDAVDFVDRKGHDAAEDFWEISWNGTSFFDLRIVNDDDSIDED